MGASLSSFGQLDTRIGDWKVYLSHNQAVQSVERKGTVFTITGGGMFAYTPESGTTETFSTIEGMSNINATTIHYAPENDLLFIGYEDGMIDYYTANNTFDYITDIRRNEFFTQKRINSFASNDKQLFVGTNFGLVVYTLDDLLPAFTITQIADNSSQTPVVSVAEYNRRIWVVLENEQLYSAPTDFPNLTDPSIWRAEIGVDDLPDSVAVRQVAATPTALYVTADTLVYRRFNHIWRVFHEAPQDRYVSMYSRGNQLGFAVRGETVTLTEGVQGHFRTYIESTANSALPVDDAIYIAGEFQGLIRVIPGTGRDTLSPIGPTNNNAIRVAAGNGEVYIAPRGYDESLVTVADAAGIYYFSQNTGWKILNQFNGTLPSDRSNASFARAYYDESSNTAYIGSWGRGMVSLKNGELLNAYDCANSGLSFIYNTACDNTIPDNTRVSGMDKDNNGNLWVSMAFAQSPVAMLSSSGTWFDFPSSQFAGGLHLVDLITDDWGTKWMINRKSGLVVYNHNNTPSDLSDDISFTLTSGLNQGDLPSNNVFSIAKDKDGFVWVGTDLGAVVFYDVFSISQGNRVDAICPVLNQRCLLKDEIINAIAVDGGNRKWMATNNGVYLIGADGDESITHFTEENSPLLSNGVQDVAVDNSTGEVFFATDRGLISWRGESTEGKTNCDDVYVFPNPVFTDYDGLITIDGTPAESVVKITTVSGRLVRELRSEGGRTTWDGLDAYGNKVKSGVYLAFIANRNGENPCIGKFAIVSR